MPGTKRTTKTASYTEHNDDDDFMATADNTKKTRSMKSNDQQTELNSSTRQLPRKRKEKLSKAEQEELDLALKLSTETVQSSETSIEIPITNDGKEILSSTSTISSNESKTTTEKESNEQDENPLPKSKRMKRDEEEENVDENESNSEEEEEEDEEEPTPRKKTIRKTEEKNKNSEISTVPSSDLNSSRLITRGQQKSSISTTDLSMKKSNAPLGFPTNKIIIPSLQTSRVGLSRKVSVIKPLHPNLNQRITHE
ncbi:unnamed protein product [Rotaria sp. Silwood2]|nr:unnamed protein product [Rotaria sp. Silwood2]CAF2498832.1 unnamed protein product [Rotaria sp. Silwood2]CAF2896430.1 unnamed protein product [Rotaria sp. Silwood2]CAF4077272.1 unnamed protein product [Rotaria sp. Silwood2]CAF4398534.1 unnamed protein product [Rotaria sp. Silwood2]